MNRFSPAGDDLGSPHLQLERRGDVAWCFVDRPAARNALSPAMYRGIGRAVQLAERDERLRALVLTARGDVFIPGGEMGGSDSDPMEKVVPSRFLPFDILRTRAVPVVAAINGACFASGLLFAMLTDVAVASERATFRAPELLRGFPDMWLAAVLPAHVGVGRARELALTGRRIDAGEAQAIGLIERVVAHDDLEASAHLAVEQLLRVAPDARVLWSRELHSRYGVIDEAGLDAAVDSPEVDEGFRAFLEKRQPSWIRTSTTQDQNEVSR